MKRILLALAALAGALLVGLSAGQGTANGTTWTCPASGYLYATYNHSLPQIGTDYTVGIKATSDYEYGGHVAAWVGVTEYDAQGDAYKWIQAGLFDPGNVGLMVYIEINDGTGAKLVYSAPASYNTVYTVRLRRIYTDSWMEAINGTNKNAVVNSTTGTQLVGEVYNSTSTCNEFNYSFVNSAWSTSSMSSHGADAPYHISNITTYGWTVSGPS